MDALIRTNINNRFFQALDMVVRSGAIRGEATFCKEHNIDRRNLIKVKSNSSDQRVRIEWIYYLCNDFSISAEWIISGKGPMFRGIL